MNFTESPLTAVKRETLRRLNERARLKEINADLLAALEGSFPYLVAWRFEYADKPQDEHNNAQRDRIDEQIRKVETATAKARDNG